MAKKATAVAYMSYTIGKSNKHYFVGLIRHGSSKWEVVSAYGPIGSSLRAGRNRVFHTEAMASKWFGDLVREKTQKGYWQHTKVPKLNNTPDWWPGALTVENKTTAETGSLLEKRKAEAAWGF